MLRARIRREEENPLTQRLIRIYQPALLLGLRHKALVGAMTLIAAAVTVPIFWRLGTEFVPPLNEGVLLYMPSTASAISPTEAKRLLQLTNATLKGFPEVEHVLGKAGRAETATDPAPLSMLETIVVLKPREQWPHPLSQQELIAKFDAAMQFPGVANSWTMPVRGRIDMLATGMRSPLGLKIAGPDLQQIQELGTRVEELLRDVRGTRTVFAERVNDGRYFDIEWDRKELALTGITIEEAQAAVQYAIGCATTRTPFARCWLRKASRWENWPPYV